MNDKESITISKKELEKLDADSLKLSALEQAGVDNWEGYPEAMKILKEMQNDL